MLRKECGLWNCTELRSHLSWAHSTHGAWGAKTFLRLSFYINKMCFVIPTLKYYHGD